MTRNHRRPHHRHGKSYTPDQVAESFAIIRANLDVIETAYNDLVPEAPAVEFLLYDSTAPGFLEAQGLVRLKCPSEGHFFPTDERGPPDLDWIKANAVPDMAQYDPLSIDVECYGKKEQEGQPPYTETDIGYLCDIVQCFLDGNPGQRVGVYMTPPERYGGCATCHPNDFQKRWDSWTERNKIMQPLADMVHMLFPSLYALYSDMNQWTTFARQNVEQTRMLRDDAPLIGYLWPQWHNNSGLSGFIPPEQWTTMLETCLEVCDGLAIWLGSDQRFDPTAPWWLATEDFMKRHKLMGR